ncbi:MAG: hypothetical protein AAFN79_16625 [Pseudomonadota bacterium]
MSAIRRIFVFAAAFGAVALLVAGLSLEAPSEGTSAGPAHVEGLGNAFTQLAISLSGR